MSSDTDVHLGVVPLSWEQYGDALLRRRVAEVLSRDGEADPLAALAVGTAAVERLLAPREPGPVGPLDDLVLDREPIDLFTAVCHLAALDDVDARVLALLLAVDADLDRQRLVAYLQADARSTALQLGTVAALLGRACLPALAPESRLVRAALVEVRGSGPWAARAAVPAPGLLWALHGDASLDPDLHPAARVLPAEEALVPAVGSVVLVVGGDPVSRRRAALADAGGAGLLSTPVPRTPAQWAATVREATLGGLSVLLEAEEDLDDDARAAVEHADHLAWAVGSSRQLPLQCVPALPWRERQLDRAAADDAQWQDVLGVPAPPGAQVDAEQLALLARTQLPLEEGLRRLAGGHLDRVTRRVRPTRTWDDLVLPDALASEVRALVARHQQRRLVFGAWGFPSTPSTGTVALLSGPSGTGKTLTAEVVAGALSLDLYVLDLSRVMSKWVGETERNLGALFDAAETGDAVLFFDEADALFGKRSAVTDAKDRYANVEVSYLLQRLERHSGLVLLATNMPSNIDEAFLRRFHAALEYPVPDEQQRLRLWQRAFPPACPVEGVDLELLAARVVTTGGPITSAALAAAFAAASEGGPVRAQHVVQALRVEFRKQGRLLEPSLLQGLEGCL